MASLRELECVGGHVHEHLAQTQGVRDDLRGHPLVHDGRHLQGGLLGVGQGGEQGEHLVYQRVQVEGEGGQLQLARLQLSVVQHVVDEPNERLPRSFRGAHVVQLVRLEGGLEQQAEHTQQACPCSGTC